MECHKCKDRTDIQAGKYSRMPYSETPCAKCELKENSDYTLEYEERRSPFAVCSEQSAEGDEVHLPISVMREAMVEFLRLPPEVRDIVCWRFAGMPYRDIATIQGITIAAVEIRHWRAMKKWPALRALFAAKAAKQSRRKNTEHKRE